MVRFCAVMIGSELANVIVPVTPVASISCRLGEAPFAPSIASRNDPGPLSWRFVTVNVAAKTPVEMNDNASRRNDSKDFFTACNSYNVEGGRLGLRQYRTNAEPLEFKQRAAGFTPMRTRCRNKRRRYTYPCHTHTPCLTTPIYAYT